LAEQRLVHNPGTIEVRSPNEGANDSEHNFPIPFHVSNNYYRLPQIDAKNEGTPDILNLADLTGEGVAGQFVLFEYSACGIAETAVLGYSQSRDAAVQYGVETSGTGAKEELVSWVEHTFGEKPIRPGIWNFSWDPGHGSESRIHEEVSFDPRRQMFVDHTTLIANQ
jgi:hypothetical protein